MISSVTTKIVPSPTAALDSLTMSWSWGEADTEVIDTQTGKCLYLLPSVLSKHALFERFVSIWIKLRDKKYLYSGSAVGKDREVVSDKCTSISETSYFQAKQYSEGYQQAKELFLSHLKSTCGVWVNKPNQLEQFKSNRSFL